VYTFDHADSLKFNIEYKPNFYLESSDKDICTEPIDLHFVGKFNPFRLSLIDNILCQLDQSSVSYFIKLWPAYKIFLHNKSLYNFLRRVNLKNLWIKN